jgi:integrase
MGSLNVQVPGTLGFLEFSEFDALVAGAEETGTAALVAVLLAAEASLRCGEIMGLRYADVDFVRQRLCIAQAIWKGHITVTKGEQFRYVKLTGRLLNALRSHRHLRSDYVLCGKGGLPMSQHMVRDLVEAAAKRAGVKNGVHILRHTFCSHLAMRGAPASMIQQLAGHKNLSTTQGYMHLSPTASDNAIGLLDERIVTTNFGEILATTDKEEAK